MYYLYIDNYRGFSNTYIPIKDVNFFVGENSTGKSSVLGLYNLLSSPGFWLRQDFNLAEVQLGTFNEIINIRSANKENFKIGVIQKLPIPKNTTKNDVSYEAFLMTFSAEDGLPIISNYHHVRGKEVSRFIFTKKDIKYKKDKLRTTVHEKNIFSIFKSWINEKIETTEFTQIKGTIPFSRKEALGHIGSLIQSIHEEKVLERRAYSVILPQFAQKMYWIAPIRSKPKRIYEGYKVDFNPEGEHIPFLIGRLLQKKNMAKIFLPYLKKIGKESGLFETIAIEKYGKETGAPFELDIILNEYPMKISNVGYGVSQVLPIIVELFLHPNDWLAIQQPEVHLHPKAQASLGDLIFLVATTEKQKFFIETHSDYLIDRFRLNYRKKQPASKIEAQILFFERTKKGNKIFPVDIMPDGNYSEVQPKNFREFFIREELSILGL